MRKIAMFLMVLVFVASSAIAGPKYVGSPPLKDAVNARVGNVGSGTVQVPLITWGGDIATILANGNRRTTAGGSIFANQGLSLKLVRQDDFKKQVEEYLSGRTPYLRGTMGMINMAAEVCNQDPRTKLNIIYQMTWSTGGDAMVVKSNIKSVKDLKGKTIAVQAYGPHVDYLATVLAGAGLTMNDVTIKWTPDLTGTDNTPKEAFYENGIDAAMVIIHDALALTADTEKGGEDSVKGAKILLSTKTANRVIADVYAVRADYLRDNLSKVQAFVHGLMLGQEALADLVAQKDSRRAEYQQMISAAADVLLDSPQAIGDAEGLYADCTYVGFPGNVQFFGDKNYPRNFDNLTREIQGFYITSGLLSKRVSLSHPKWDYNVFKQGLKNTSGVAVPQFDVAKVAKVVERRIKQNRADDSVLYGFEVYFKPNQNSFTADMYKDAFDKVINLAATYGGAIITIEGHSDSLNYLKQKKNGASSVVLRRIMQAAKNLSMTRANAVRDSLIGYAQSKGITLDESQFTCTGWGITKPQSGMCGADPCAPETKQDWLNNMRVEFKIIQVEAEAVGFEKL